MSHSLSSQESFVTFSLCENAICNTFPRRMIPKSTKDIKDSLVLQLVTFLIWIFT